MPRLQPIQVLREWSTFQCRKTVRQLHLACTRGDSSSVSRHCSMRWDTWSLCLDVISFFAAISARTKGGQWLFHEMPCSVPLPRHGQLHRSHLDRKAEWTAAASCAIPGRHQLVPLPRRDPLLRSYLSLKEERTETARAL
eukprot:7758902-Karenia_brevis.AAC.1